MLNVKNKVPMDPHQTLMGVGSVSKLLTWLKQYTTAGSVPRSLKEYLSAIPAPKRIYPPGTLPAYSNYGANLAGYIVQRISGEPFSSYIEHHILNPLGMRRSTFRRPPPAGGFVSTADDMSRFMVAHLNDGRFENAQILAPETSQLMHLTSELIPGYA
jgi:CubicO group peptidase (beta-lactamase class C family)